jgi:predicted ATPase
MIKCGAVVRAGSEVQPRFSWTASSQAAVVRICQLVHGMPLALEIAATWVRFYDCEMIAQKIARNLDFLVTSQRDMPERHRSMRAVFEQSWCLLEPGEQVALAQLSLFRGRFTLQAALEVTDATVFDLTGLLDKSLLRRQGSPGDRPGDSHFSRDCHFASLENHELLRQFAAERLGEQREALRHRHAAYYSSFVQACTVALSGGNQQQALAEIGQEIENVRLAWQWAVEQAQVEPIEQCLEGLYWFYESNSWFQEIQFFCRSLEHYNVPMRFDMLARQGFFCHRLAQYDKAKALLLESLAAASTVDSLPEYAFCLPHLASD